MVERRHRLEVGEDVLAHRRLGRLVALDRGVVAQLEEADEPGRDVRIGRDDVVLVALGEARADALAVLAIGAQDGHAPPVQAGVDDQAVQRVRLGLAAPHRRDALRDALAALLEVERQVGGAEHAEVLQPRRAVAAEQPRGPLLDHAQAEVLEDRHGLRQLDLVADAVHPDARQPVGLVAQADVEGLAPGEQALEAVDVVGRRRRVDGRLVGVGQASRPALGQHAAALVAVARDELVPGAVVPRTRELEDLGLDVAARELGQAALGTVDGEVHAHAVALGQHLVGVDRAGVEAPAQEDAQALEQRRVVAALWAARR